MTEKQEAALRLALEALEGCEDVTADVLKAITAIREALAEQPAHQQEPVAWMYQCSADSSGPVLTQHRKDWAESGSGLWTEKPLYTPPPASKPWVGLSNDEIYDMYNEPRSDAEMVEFARAIEAKLREKNA